MQTDPLKTKMAFLMSGRNTHAWKSRQVILIFFVLWRKGDYLDLHLSVWPLHCLIFGKKTTATKQNGGIFRHFPTKKRRKNWHWTFLIRVLAWFWHSPAVFNLFDCTRWCSWQAFDQVLYALLLIITASTHNLQCCLFILFAVTLYFRVEWFLLALVWGRPTFSQLV